VEVVKGEGLGGGFPVEVMFMKLKIDYHEVPVAEAGACLYCGFCRDGCPIYRAFGIEPQLIPVHRLYRMMQLESADPKIDTENMLSLGDDWLNNLYLCILCNYCQEVCPYETDFTDKNQKTRIYLVEKGLAPRKVFEKALWGIRHERNPYREPHKSRFDWMKSLNVKLDKKAKTILYVGCTSSYRRQEIIKAAVQVLNKSGVGFNVLGEKEWCCGSPIIRMGFLKEAEKLAKHNLKAMSGFEELVTPCAGCYRTFKLDYPEYFEEPSFKVTHLTEFLNRKISEGEIDPGEADMRVTYHDPCHLGRHSGVYDAPRDLLKSIKGLKLIEMYPSRERAWCCGAGAGVKMGFPELAVKVAGEKVELAQDLKVQALTTACPFCKTNLMDAAKKMGSNLKVLDVCEILAETVKITPAQNS
jgi:heterodisulfide reductase subunit D